MLRGGGLCQDPSHQIHRHAARRRLEDHEEGPGEKLVSLRIDGAELAIDVVESLPPSLRLVKSRLSDQGGSLDLSSADEHFSHELRESRIYVVRPVLGSGHIWDADVRDLKRGAGERGIVEADLSFPITFLRPNESSRLFVDSWFAYRGGNVMFIAPSVSGVQCPSVEKGFVEDPDLDVE